MKKSIQSVVLTFMVFTGLLIGCAPALTPVPITSTPLPENTVLPTDRPVPTKTPILTQTPIPPTATLPAPEKSFEYFNGVQVIGIDTFDNPSKGGWGFDAGTIKDGFLEVKGKNWNGLVRDGDFKDNQGIIVDFTYSKSSVFEMLVDNGVWWTEPYKRFGIYIDKNYARVNVWVGKNGLGGASLSGNFTPKPDTTYSLLMAILPGGGFLGVIWDPSDLSKTIFYREKIGKNWSDLTWKFKIGADNGTILFDNFREIKFDSVK